jgi:hypothetical protein
MGADKYSRLKAAGKLTGTLKECREKRAKRDALKRSKKVAKTVVIPFGRRCSRIVRDRAVSDHPRKQNWAGCQELRDRKTNYVTVHTEDVGKYGGQYRKYTCYIYHPATRSFGLCTPKRLLWFYWKGHGTLKAKRGWHFGRDTLGLYVQKNSDKRDIFRYHFTMDDIQSGMLWDNAALHREGQEVSLARETNYGKYMQKAKELGVYVTMQDSRASGNCAAGTISFCRSHNLNYRSAYPVEVVERFATNGHAYQVQRAIQAAVERSITDLARGYCLLPQGDQQ